MELSNEDIKFITDETLDFALFSPFDGQAQGSSAEHRERCVPKKIDMNILLGENVGGLREQTSEWSPLSPEKLEEVMKEANFLAEQLESCRLLERDCSETRLETVPEFEPLPPTGVLQVEKLIPRNPRRRTFSVSNSPLKELLPLVGPETCSDQVSSKAPFPEDSSPVSCAAEVLSSRKLQQRPNICRTDSQLSKKSRPSQPLKIRTMTSNCKKTTSRSSGKDKPSPLALSHAKQAQDSLLHLKTLPRASQRGLQRKTQEASGKASVEDPQIFPAVAVKEEHKLSLQNVSSRSVVPVAHTRGKLGPRLGPLQNTTAKKSPAAPGKLIPPRKASTSQNKAPGGSGLPCQASSKPQSCSLQSQTRRTAMSALASQLPVPKASSRIATLGRHTTTGRPSQLKPLGLGGSAGKETAMPTSAGKKVWICRSHKCTCQPSSPQYSSDLLDCSPIIPSQHPQQLTDVEVQKTAPSTSSQNCRLQSLKKGTSGNSK